MRAGITIPGDILVHIDELIQALTGKLTKSASSKKG
jgi:hypothetical protein